MLYTDEMENNVLTRVKREFDEADNKDTINKIYRQARNWVRFHCYYAKACTPEKAHELNEKLKNLRWDRLSQLGYITVKTTRVAKNKEA